MAYENVILKDTIQAGEDLQSFMYFAVSLDDGQLAQAGHEASGIIYGKVEDDAHVPVGILGIMKYRAGDDITKGDRLTVQDSGLFYTAGSGYFIVGTAKTTVTSGSIGTGYFNFISPIYAQESSFVK